jgi:hypothetical protein
MHEIHIPYKGAQQQFEFWCRPLWDWLMNLLEDLHLAFLFEWDAQRLSKFDGQTWKRFVHEPWTAERFWTVQVCDLYYTQCKSTCSEILVFESQIYPLMQSHYALPYILTRQDFPHLELHKDIPLWLNVLICQERFEMEKAWAPPKLLDGFPLYVLYVYPFLAG